jgi:cob(I)alamin adenosyltransferase
MHISTKKGDSGYTGLLTGGRVPKHHLIIEAVGTLDEANSELAVARASSQQKRTKRIILQVQKQLFIIGAELSVPKGKGKAPKKIITEIDIKWLERLIDQFEEALALPPGFVAFGQNEGSSHLDVARTSVRKVERLAVKMKSRDMMANLDVLKYLNRLSDLIFLLACFEEKDEEEQRQINRTVTSSQLNDSLFRRWIVALSAAILALIAAIIFFLVFHKPSPQATYPDMQKHMEQMDNMHKFGED